MFKRTARSKREQPAKTAKPTEEDSISANTEHDSESDIPSEYQFQEEKNNNGQRKVKKIASNPKTIPDRGISWKPGIMPNPAKEPKTEKPSFRGRQAQVKEPPLKEPTNTSNVALSRSGRLIKAVEKLQI